MTGRLLKSTLIAIAALAFVALSNRDVAAQGCSGDATKLLFPLDGTYTLVDFFGDGATGNGPAGADQRNDDDSATMPLGFTFDLYGDSYTTAFINNNGNLSFANPFSTFTASGFPSATFKMVAPFWADVDSRNLASGQAWQKLVDSNGDTNPDTLIVTWDNVGYFNSQADLKNTFQVAISDGTNPAMGIGNNVCFSWDNMCWTTGSASNGIGGFGGTPATVGANRGNGTEFFQIGRFDHAGTDYDGPFGNNDGVSHLDNSSTCFSAASGTINIAPIPTGFPAGNRTSVDPCLGESLNLTLQFLSPEAGQTTTVTITDPDGAQAAGLVITNTPGNVAQVGLAWTNPPVGTYTLKFQASDDFVPAGVTNIALVIDVACSTGCGNNVVDGNEQCDGTADDSCPGLCIAAGSPNECTCGVAPPVCGDNTINPGEDCDGTADAACPGDCVPPGSAAECTCPPPPGTCGNNVVDAGEECDGTSDAACPGRCIAGACVCSLCGNGVVDEGETCDDGNRVSGCDPIHKQRPLDDCRNDCTRPMCKDPARITYGENGDKFFIHVRLITTDGRPRDMAGKPFAVALTSGDEVVFRTDLPAQTIEARGNRFRYDTGDARPRYGVAKLKALRQPGYYLVSFTCQADLRKATPDMKTHVYIGDEEWTLRGKWRRTPGGWRLDERVLMP